MSMNIDYARRTLEGQHYFIRIDEVVEETPSTGSSVIWVVCTITEGPMKDFVITIPFSEILKDKPTIDGVPTIEKTMGDQ